MLLNHVIKVPILFYMISLAFNYFKMLDVRTCSRYLIHFVPLSQTRYYYIWIRKKQAAQQLGVYILVLRPDLKILIILSFIALSPPSPIILLKSTPHPIFIIQTTQFSLHWFSVNFINIVLLTRIIYSKLKIIYKVLLYQYIKI